MYSCYILAYTLFFFNFHHEWNCAYKHAIGLFHARVTTTVIDCGVSHFLLSQQSSKCVAERSLEQLIGGKTVFFAPVVDKSTIDVGRLLSHLANGVLGTRRQCGEINTSIARHHHRFSLQVVLVAQSCVLVDGGLKHSIFLFWKRLAIVSQRQVALWEYC